jgi:hypothetical protein
MNEMLALLPTGSYKDDSLFRGLFLRKLPTSMRDQLAAADHQTAAAMVKHSDMLRDARCGESAITAANTVKVDSALRVQN